MEESVKPCKPLADVVSGFLPFGESRSLVLPIMVGSEFSDAFLLNRSGQEEPERSALAVEHGVGRRAMAWLTTPAPVKRG